MTDFSSMLTDLNAHLEAGRVVSFQDTDETYRALQSACVAVPLLGSKVLRVTGADRLDFVHGQVSAEVKRLGVGTFSDSLLLNHRGHALAQLRVFRRQDDLLLVTEGGAGAVVKDALEAHIIFDQVELEALDDITLTLQGATARQMIETVLDDVAPKGHTFSEVAFGTASALLSSSQRSGQGGYDLTVPAETAPDLYRNLLDAGATAAGEKALDLARVLAGIPNAGNEGGEGVLPQEAGLEPLVSYTKGCYLGQEIMARIEARGNLRRGLSGVQLAALPAAGERDITAEGRKVGRLGTVVHHPEMGILALAVLRRDLDSSAALQLGEVSARQVALPFTGANLVVG